MVIFSYLDLLKKAIDRTKKQPSVKMKLDNPVVVSTCMACGLYLTAIRTLSQLKLDIQAGRYFLCFNVFVILAGLGNTYVNFREESLSQDYWNVVPNT